MTKIKIFGLENYDDYWKKRKERDRTGLSEIHNIIISLVEKNAKPGATVLDLGVGPGHVFRELQKKYNCYGVEIAQEALDMYDFSKDQIAKGDFTKEIPNFGGVNTFDVIIASNIFHHLKQPIEFLRELKKRMDKNSILIFVTPNVSFVVPRIKYFFKGEFPDLSASHINFITPREYQTIFAEEGMEIAEVVGMGRHKNLIRLNPYLFSGGLFFVLRLK
jgi:2-polyprenyl-3-methyl-5-hydroxy-6-metoxy-1,4-benzoquinol methylase